MPWLIANSVFRLSIPFSGSKKMSAHFNLKISGMHNSYKKQKYHNLSLLKPQFSKVCLLRSIFERWQTKVSPKISPNVLPGEGFQPIPYGDVSLSWEWFGSQGRLGWYKSRVLERRELYKQFPRSAEDFPQAFSLVHQHIWWGSQVWLEKEPPKRNRKKSLDSHKIVFFFPTSKNGKPHKSQGIG